MRCIKKAVYFILLMVISLGFSGCGIDEISNYLTTEIKDLGVPMSGDGTGQLSNELKEKYGVSQEMDFAPFYNIPEDAKFKIHFNSNVSPVQAVSVHTNSDCNIASIVYQINDSYKTDSGYDIIVNPDKLSENGDKIWGRASIYYLCIRCNMQTEDVTLLEEPIIIPFTIKHKISTPNAVAHINEDGQFSIQWNSVKEAISYNIYQDKLINDNGYLSETVKLIATVDGSNTEFMNFDMHNNIGISTDNYIHTQNAVIPGVYYVVAIDKDGNESAFSKPIDGTKYHHLLPHNFENQSVFEKQNGIATKLPSSVMINMCDESTSEYSISYNLVSTNDGIATYDYVINGTLLNGQIEFINKTKEYEQTILGEQISSAMLDLDNSIDIIPENTIKTINKSDYVQICTDVINGEKLNYEEDLQNRLLMEETRLKDGSYKKNIYLTTDYKVSEYLYNKSIMTQYGDRYLFADSAEEEYLAICLSDAKKQINLYNFPKLQNIEYMLDVLYKTIYQNPYILGVSKFSYDAENAVLYITYKKTVDEIKSQQSEITIEANNILQTIITDDMTDNEKILAIWDYLENNTIYDHDACDEAIKTDFKNINNYEDSFSTYGIMVLKKGVCQSYMHSVKLLCSLAGVNCKSLTGYLQYTTPHGWNMVEIDGRWSWIDMTNNKTNSGVSYFIYQTSSEFANKSWGYVLNKDYEIDKYLDFAETDNMEDDYYYSKGLYARSYKDIIDIIMNRIIEFDGNIYIKCAFEPNIDDERFTHDICNALLDIGYTHDVIANTVYGNIDRIMIIKTNP